VARDLPAGTVTFLADGDAETAARLGVVCRDYGFDPDPLLGETTNAVRSAVGGQFDEASARGATLDLAAAVDLAVGALSATERPINSLAVDFEPSDE
jgi:methanogenic corrinoid protein MtbC1